MHSAADEKRKDGQGTASHGPRPDGSRQDGLRAEGARPGGAQADGGRRLTANEPSREQARDQSREQRGEPRSEGRDDRRRRLPPVRLRFTKMHGIGNDVMVLDLVTQRAQLTPEIVRTWGDRHTGIGFDQLMVLEPPNSPDCDFVVRIFNTDGSSAMHCGNGVRCVGRFIAQEKLSPKRRLTLELPRGRIEVRLLGDDAVEVDMGQPFLALADIPFDERHARRIDTHRFELDTCHGPVTVLPVSVGNPHAVIFVDAVQHAHVAEIGAEVERHPAFPERVNVGFCEVVDRGFMRLRVFERGVGETRACGSGACAAAIAARLVDAMDEHMKVSLPGGRLRIAWPGIGHVVRMTGPTALVYEGQLEL